MTGAQETDLGSAVRVADFHRTQTIGRGYNEFTTGANPGKCPSSFRSPAARVPSDGAQSWQM
jgi:hypothetical protein